MDESKYADGFYVQHIYRKGGQILDDIVYCSIFACILMIFIDIYFSKLIGYSFIKEFEGYSKMWISKYINPQVILYAFVASVPVGTVVITYLGTLVLGSRLKLLKGYGNEKFMLVKNYGKISYYMCCSKNIIIIGIIYLVFLEALELFNYDIKIVYLKVIVTSVKYILLYVTIKDANSFIGKYVYMKTKSKALFRIVNLVLLILLVINFRVVSWVMILGGMVINVSLNMRKKQLVLLKKCI